MIELPHEFLDALFTILIAYASVNRSRRRAGLEKGLLNPHFGSGAQAGGPSDLHEARLPSH